MQNLKNFLLEETSQAIIQLLQEKGIQSHEEFLPPLISQATQAQFGHYQCNSAMQLAKRLKTNPREIANYIVEKLKANSAFSKIEVAGPGFINITFDRAFINNMLNKQVLDDRLGVELKTSAPKVVIDFSSPNVAKELHVGHLRSTIIGDTLARLFEFLGYKVKRLNHVGDFGTQFGMLIHYLKLHEPEIFSGKKQASLSELMQWYRASKVLFDEDPHFKKQAQLSAMQLQQGDKQLIKAWKAICEVSRRAYNDIYSLLDVTIEERGESFYQPYIKEVLSRVRQQDLLTESDGAQCMFFNQFKGMNNELLPLILQKSDGGFNYATTDLTAVWHRAEVEQADRIIYVVDLGQKLHLEMIFEAAKKIGFVQDDHPKLEHVGFGVVLGENGKKLKTRSGETIRLMDLIQEAIARAKTIMEERLEGATEEELEQAAEVLGIDAVKYSDLSCHRQKDYVFSFDRMLRFEGNTAAFLLYSYVRIQSIKKKANLSVEDVLKTSRISITSEAEMDLGVHLLQFSEALHAMDVELLPNRLCDYLFHLAEKFNIFFRDCQVIGHPEQNSRLMLAELTSKVLKKGLNLLGLKTLNRM